MTRPGKLRQLLERAVLVARANMSQYGLPMSPAPLIDYPAILGLLMDAKLGDRRVSRSPLTRKRTSRPRRNKRAITGEQYSRVSAHDREDSLEASQYPLAQGSHSQMRSTETRKVHLLLGSKAMVFRTSVGHVGTIRRPPNMFEKAKMRVSL